MAVLAIFAKGQITSVDNWKRGLWLLWLEKFRIFATLTSLQVKLVEEQNFDVPAYILFIQAKYQHISPSFIFTNMASTAIMFIHRDW